jgi:tetratricopeptide (TPR) repeat protein
VDIAVIEIPSGKSQAAGSLLIGDRSSGAEAEAFVPSENRSCSRALIGPSGKEHFSPSAKAHLSLFRDDPRFAEISRTITAGLRLAALLFHMQRILSTLAVMTALVAVGCGSTSNGLTKNPAAAGASPLKDPTLLVQQGEAFAANGDFTRAQQYFAAAIAAGGKSKAILPHLLKACIASGDLRLASEYAENELARNPDDAHLRFLTGALQAQTGNRPAARDHLVQAAKELGTDPNVQFSVATFFRDDMQDRIEADPYFRDYLRLAPRGEHVAEARGSLMERVQ